MRLSIYHILLLYFILCLQSPTYISHGTRRRTRHIAFDHKPEFFEIHYGWAYRCTDPFNTSWNGTRLLHGAQHSAVCNQ